MGGRGDEESFNMTLGAKYEALSPSLIFTARKRSLGQGTVLTPVCHSVHRRGVSVKEGGSLSVWVSVRETPPCGKERAVRILLECILVL